VRARVHSIAWPEHPRSVFVEVFERSPDDARGTGGPASATATLHLDRAGFVVASNQPCRATFGDETDDLVGAHVDALVAFGAVPSAEILARVTDRGEPVDVADATLLTDRGVHATSARVRATHDLLRPIAIELFSTDDRSERTTP
jgi:nitrogen-specific signal transduction histidine kinase